MQISIRSLVTLLAFLPLLLGIAGCKTEYPLLKADECPNLIKHSKALLGEGVKDKTDEELLAVCKRSTARQRGCVKMATVAADIMKCSLVQD